MSKVLVIEDSPEVRERIVASLTFEGFDVVDAEDGEAACKWRAMPDPI
ncbi:MAG: response regulator [Alphaproteobacteria bacterium]